MTEGGEAMPGMQNWLVIRTRPRWEKKVAKLLQEKGIEAFCPMVQTRRQWSDRVKTIDMPLLKSFLFVRICEEQRTTVRLIEGVVNFVYRDGKPAVLKEKQVQHIRQFQQVHPQLVALEAKREDLSASDEKKQAPTLRIETLNILLIGGQVQPLDVKASSDN